MIISASKLKLRNVGQLVEFVHNSVAVMGRVELVMIHTATEKVELRLSGHGKSFTLKSEHLLNIIRTTEAYEAYQGTLALEEIVNMRKVDA